MDSEDPTSKSPSVESDPQSPLPETPRKLPKDLPTSLDDRRAFSNYGEETEIYDGWQGKDFPHSPGCLVPSQDQY
jgi:hypothetical protein